MDWMIEFMAKAYDVTFSPWFMVFVCVLLAAFTGGALFSAFGG